MVYHVIWVLCKYSEQSEPETAKCREPANLTEELERLQEDILYLHRMGTASFHIIPEYRNQNAELYSNINKMLPTKQQTIFGTPRCRAAKRDPDLNLTCPWYVNLDYDENRLPQTMAKAECTCDECIKVAGYCEKVYTYQTVIRRYCISDTFEYRLAMEPVPVGCTCRHELRNKHRHEQN